MKIRYSVLEEKTRKLIVKYVNVQQSYERKYSVSAIEQIKKFNNSNKLFQDADSPYLTTNGNPQVTEFVLHAPKHKINWRIECAYQKTYSKNIGKLHYELSRVEKLREEKFILILDGMLDCKQVKSELKELIKLRNIKKRVWFGNVREFEELLIKKTN